jgi:hypothetical protein
MRPEDRFLFFATRQRLDPERKAAMLALAEKHALRWDQVFLTAKEHGVAPLIYSNVTGIPELSAKIPENILKTYKLYTFNQIVYKRERARQIADAVKYFKAKKIDVILFKGAALDILVYDQPWYTTSKDVDIVLSVKQEELTPAQIEEIGDHFNRQTLEYDFYEHHDMNMNGMLPIPFEEVWEDARQIKILDQEALVLSPEDMLLSICVNSCRKRYLYLKSLLDIVETIEKYPYLNWDEFADRCQQYGCANIVYTALLVAGSTLGGNIPAPTLTALSPNMARSALITFCIKSLLQFDSLHTTNSKSFITQSLDPALLLPYATYMPGQMRQKIRLSLANRDH